MLIFITLLIILTVYLCRRYQFFVLPIEEESFIEGYKLLIAYGLVILTLPLSKMITNLFFDKNIFAWQSFVFHFLYLILISLFITFFLTKKEKLSVLGKNFFSNRFFKDIFMGIISFFVLIPFLSLIDYFVLQIFNYYGISHLTDQVAVQAIKRAAQESQFLLYSLIFVATILTPIVEELWFRGFLQNWLKRYLGRKWTIILVAIFFSIIHYSTSQGIANTIILLKLFVVGLFLGFIFERQKSLIASIALHSFFNSVMALSLVVQLE